MCSAIVRASCCPASPVSAGDLDERADLGVVVDVRADRAGPAEARVPAEHDVLADRAGELLERLGERARAAERRLQQRRAFGAGRDAIDRSLREQRVGDLLGRLAELLGARDEVRLAIQLDQRARAAVVVDVAPMILPSEACASRAGFAARDAFLAQQLDGLVHVALALIERLLAIHHAGAGALTQLGDVLGGIRSHFLRQILAWRGNAAGMCRRRMNPNASSQGALSRRPRPSCRLLLVGTSAAASAASPSHPRP